MSNTVSYTINKVEDKMAELSISNDQGQRMKVNAEVSPQLLGIIKSEKTKREFIGVTYTSTFDSPSFDENPLKLKQFINPDGTHKNWRLELVTDRGTDYLRDVFGRKVKAIHKHYSPEHFRRFIRIQL